MRNVDFEHFWHISILQLHVLPSHIALFSTRKFQLIEFSKFDRDFLNYYYYLWWKIFEMWGYGEWMRNKEEKQVKLNNVN